MLIAVWDEQNTAHVEEHGLTTDDVDYVLANPTDHGTSRKSGRPAVFGFTPGDRFIIVVYEELDDVFVYPVTAYEIPE